MEQKEFKITYVDPKSLIDYEHNNKIHTEEQVELLGDIFESVGFDVPVVTDEKKIIIKGHCRKYSVIKKNIPLIPCIIRDDLSEEQKKLARIADNKLPENSQWDYSNLKEELNFLKDIGVDLRLTGFNENELPVIMDDIDNNFSFDDDLDDDKGQRSNIEGSKDGRSYLCEIGFKGKETAETFLRSIGVQNYRFKGMTKIVDGDREVDFSAEE
jgi:hypothetical protein